MFYITIILCLKDLSLKLRTAISIKVVPEQSGNKITYLHCLINYKRFTFKLQYIFLLKKFINNSRGKYKRNECLINVCISDKDFS
jgi:hypothetical protein